VGPLQGRLWETPLIRMKQTDGLMRLRDKGHMLLLRDQRQKPRQENGLRFPANG
jgi:hypothetical protein